MPSASSGFKICTQVITCGPISLPWLGGWKLGACAYPQYWGSRVKANALTWNRVPFLDKSFLEIAMETIPSSAKLHSRPPYNFTMEKHILRKAFDVDESKGEEPYLPKEILWRQKEQFSDGVGYGWIDGLKDYAGKTVSCEKLAAAASRYLRHPFMHFTNKLIRRIIDGLMTRPLQRKLTFTASSLSTISRNPRVRKASSVGFPAKTGGATKTQVDERKRCITRLTRRNSKMDLKGKMAFRLLQLMVLRMNSLLPKRPRFKCGEIDQVWMVSRLGICSLCM